MNLRLINIVPTCALALLLSACGKEQALSEQVFSPVTLEMSYGDVMSSIKYDDLTAGKIRYIIRTFPVGAIYSKVNPVQEFIFTKDVNQGFDHTETLDLLEGDYDLMVWSDLMKEGESVPCHNADNFGEISLHVASTGNNDYRDAFCGVATVSVDADESSSLTVEMERPLARFELVSNDLPEFVGSQTGLADGSATLDDYTAVVFYQGYVPTVYSLYADKPVDSQTGVMFTSALTELNDNEVSLGFDYVFIGDKSSYVTVRVGVYDLEGKQVSLTSSIKVPLQRNECTVKSGSFLTSKSSDGINIDKELDGNHNIEF